MMDTMFSPSWYKVAGLQPRLRGHADIHRHSYRGRIWYVLQDRLAGRHHRFSPPAYFILSLLDGERTLQAVWDLALEHLGDECPTQDEVIRLFGQLHASDLLLCDVPPDSEELLRRTAKQRYVKWRQYLSSPLSLRFPLWDPDRFLTRGVSLVAPAFSGVGALLWFAVVGTAFLAGISHWDELTMDVTDRVLGPNNLVMLVFVYPAVKLLHEMGHGFATKVWGGEVHEFGVMFLIFMPVPYVDASSATAFRDKRKRMLVGAAGMLVELFLASIAMFVWLNVEPGVARSIAYDVMVVGSVSTLFFNANPLLRFDGYFILSDAVEIPNLYGRSAQYVAYLFQRYAIGGLDMVCPANTPGERRWLFVYGVGAFCYRIVVAFTIVLLVAEKFFFIGVLCALWAAATMLGVPINKGLRFVFTSPTIHRRRGRAITVVSGLAVSVVVLLVFAPWPWYTLCEGVVWLPENAHVRAGTGGVVRALLSEVGGTVKQGDPVLQLDDPTLAARQSVVEFRLQELNARYNAGWITDLAKARLLKEEIESAQAELERVRGQAASLIVRSQADGILILPRADDLVGKWFEQGDVVGYVVQYPLLMVRAVVNQEDIGLVRQRVQAVHLRPVEQVGRVYQARIEREVPKASNELPSPALGKSSGGEIANDPTDAKGVKAFETVFQFDLSVLEAENLGNIGSRIYVRFDHGTEPLAFQWYRKIRQTFLKRYGV